MGLEKNALRQIRVSGTVGDPLLTRNPPLVVHKPKILLADEPTGNLDPQLSEEIMSVLNKFCEAGSTVLVASHDLELVSSIAQRLLRLEKGFLVEDKKTL